MLEHIPLYVVGANGTFLQKPGMLCLRHMSIVEKPFISGGKVSQFGATWSVLIIGGYVPWALLGWTNTIDNIPLLTPNETVYTERVGKKICSLLLRPYHKSLSVLKTLLQMYSQADTLVFDLLVLFPLHGHACRCGIIASVWYLTWPQNASIMEFCSRSKCLEGTLKPHRKILLDLYLE